MAHVVRHICGTYIMLCRTCATHRTVAQEVVWHIHELYTESIHFPGVLFKRSRINRSVWISTQYSRGLPSIPWIKNPCLMKKRKTPFTICTVGFSREGEPFLARRRNIEYCQDRKATLFAIYNSCSFPFAKKEQSQGKGRRR